MSSVLDAFALVALALNEPAAAEVEATLRRGDCRVSAVNLAEALDQLGRVHGHPRSALEAAFRPVFGGDVTIVAADEEIAWTAAELRARHYRRRHSELSLADCVGLATVRTGEQFLTADPALARAARAEGIDVVGLPDTSGRRP